MIRKYFYGLSLILLTVTARGYQDNDFFKEYYEKVDGVFDEQEAFNTVAFIEKYWRIPGNTGFNESIYHVVERLEKAGFILEDEADSSARLVYRIEKRPMRVTTWEPVSGSFKLSNGEELLNFNTNRHMMAMNSYSTDGEREFEVVYVGSGRGLDMSNVKGKIAYGETNVSTIYNLAVIRNGAVGAIGYSMPGYLRPEKNQNSIQFKAIRRDPENKGFGLMLSFAAKQKLDAALKAGNNKVKVNLETKVYNAEELTLVAELRGSKLPEERFVFSAHVQEPGANDNASGVAVLAETAVVSAKLLKEGSIDPERTITYLFGDEIISTRRFIEEDKTRAQNIKWGMSLDMVGENTAITGGSFLIEKMPDPGAIWTRGPEKHSQWGGRVMRKEQMKPHYFNDLVIRQFQWIGKQKNWEVNYNPFEGGSDHVPFLSADIPGLLLWHFTDQFYHTDQDRIDKVSKKTMKNVGTGALSIALMLTENKPEMPYYVLNEVADAAYRRLEGEYNLSNKEVADGADLAKEDDILSTWADWYQKAIESTYDVGGSRNDQFKSAVIEKLDALNLKRDRILTDIRKQ